MSSLASHTQASVSCSSSSKIHAGNVPTLPQTKSCPMCSTKFTRTTHLNRHLRSHTNERQYHCDICQSQFTRSDLLARHKRTCGDPNANRSRRKSCQSCAASKIKCDLQWPCSKCTARGRKCEFINDPRVARDKKAALAARRGSIASSDASETTASDETSECCSSPSPSIATSFPLTFERHGHHGDISCDMQQLHLAVPPDSRYYAAQAPETLFDGLYDPAHVSPTLPELSHSPTATPVSMYSYPEHLNSHCSYTTEHHSLTTDISGGHSNMIPDVYSPDPMYQGVSYGGMGSTVILNGSITSNAAMYGLYNKSPISPYVMTPETPSFNSPTIGYGTSSAWESHQQGIHAPNMVPSVQWSGYA